MGGNERIERRLTLHDMRVLMTVVEAGSMGKAAKRLGTSQSAISRAISDLEHALGVRLVDRGPRGIEATSYGRALITRGIVVFDELGQGIKDIGFLTDPTKGELRISASIAVAVGFASAAIDRLARKYPGLSFQVLASDTATAIRALDERKADLAVVHMIGLGVEAHMNAEILFHEPHVVAAGVQNPWTRRRKIELADLVDEPWTLPPADSHFGLVVEEAFRSKGLDVPRATITSSLPVRNALLATGRFLTMAPRGAFAYSAKNSTLKALPIELPTTRRPLAIITLKNRTLNPAGDLFVESTRVFAKEVIDSRGSV